MQNSEFVAHVEEAIRGISTIDLNKTKEQHFVKLLKKTGTYHNRIIYVSNLN